MYEPPNQGVPLASLDSCARFPVADEVRFAPWAATDGSEEDGLYLLLATNPWAEASVVLIENRLSSKTGGEVAPLKSLPLPMEILFVKLIDPVEVTPEVRKTMRMP